MIAFEGETDPSVGVTFRVAPGMKVSETIPYHGEGKQSISFVRCNLRREDRDMKNKELPHLFYSGERVSKKWRVSIGGMASSDFKASDRSVFLSR